MTNAELQAIVNKAKEQYEDDFVYVGIRFEDKERSVNEQIADCSKDNSDRADERDFPDYGTTDYTEMPELDGVCAYNISTKFANANNADRQCSYCDHAYILGSRYAKIGLDDDEIIMRDAVVLEIVF